jgi:rare lipoprotein A
MHKRLAHGLALGFLVASLGAAQGPNISEATPAPISPVRSKTQARKANKQKPFQEGTASWYGQTFEGKPTASGEPYEMYDMTAAHLTLPLGSYVKVTNLRNGRSVVVRVNDRGPIVPGRIIDVSYGAAQALQFRQKGLQRVRLDLVKVPQSKAAYDTVAYNHPPIAELP